LEFIHPPLRIRLGQAMGVVCQAAISSPFLQTLS
jgi:hypothetical protein